MTVPSVAGVTAFLASYGFQPVGSWRDVETYWLIGGRDYVLPVNATRPVYESRVASLIGALARALDMDEALVEAEMLEAHRFRIVSSSYSLQSLTPEFLDTLTFFAEFILDVIYELVPFDPLTVVQPLRVRDAIQGVINPVSLLRRELVVLLPVHDPYNGMYERCFDRVSAVLGDNARRESDLVMSRVIRRLHRQQRIAVRPQALKHEVNVSLLKPGMPRSNAVVFDGKALISLASDERSAVAARQPADIPTVELSLVGYVERLERGPRFRAGRVVVSAEVQGKTRRVHLDLDVLDYGTALEAHRFQRPVKFTAVLALRANRIFGVNVSRFEKA